MKQRFLVPAVLMIVLQALAGSASAMRCGSDLIAIGDSKVEVLQACGEPLSVESVGSEKSGGRKSRVEEWIYDPGEGSFLQILTFSGGRLANIERGGKLD